MSELTIVMYHYVRDLENSRYPEIKGLRVTEFRAQLEHLRHRYRPVTVQDIVEAGRASEALPPNAALLTFDDGYIDHYTNVFPLLDEANIQGAFFPPAGAIQRSELLDVNRIHFVLASTENKTELSNAVNAFVLEKQAEFQLSDPREYWEQYGKPSRFDTAEVIYIKRMLQVVLPESLRNELAKRLFQQYVSVDEAAFAKELYVSMDQLALMARSGMYIGSHGDSHQWLDSLDREQQANEIEASLEFLRKIGSPVDDYWAIAYPYGGWNKTLLEELQTRGCSFGLTTEVAVANLKTNHALCLPRLDTNDLPKTAAA